MIRFILQQNRTCQEEMIILNNITDVTTIGKRIQELREKKNMTQTELAKDLNVKQQTINQWEKGERDLKTGAIIALAKYFNVTADYILCISDYYSIENDKIGKITGLEDETISLLTICSQKPEDNEALKNNTNAILNHFLRLILKFDIPLKLYRCWNMLRLAYKECNQSANNLDNKTLVFELSDYISAIYNHNLCIETLTKIVNRIVRYNSKKIEEIHENCMKSAYNVLYDNEIPTTLKEGEQNGNDTETE